MHKLQTLKDGLLSAGWKKTVSDNKNEWRLYNPIDERTHMEIRVDQEWRGAGIDCWWIKMTATRYGRMDLSVSLGSVDLDDALYRMPELEAKLLKGLDAFCDQKEEGA